MPTDSRTRHSQLETQNSTPSPTHRRFVCFALLLISIPIGIAWRMAPLHLPPFAFKYGGSALWAIAVYWTLAIVLPRWQPRALAPIAAIVALAVEVFKLARIPAVDAFRETLAGKLLIGRYFTVGAIIAYWLAIAAVALLDAHFQPGHRVR
jgi:Protein of unknown function (DUF2809)